MIRFRLSLDFGPKELVGQIVVNGLEFFFHTPILWVICRLDAGIH